MGKRTKEKTIATSDPDNTKVIPRHFLNMLDGSRTRKDYVVFLYDDGFVEKVVPEKLTTEKIKPRFLLLATYADKLFLEPGIEIRIRWDAIYKRARAVIKGVNVDSVEMDRLFDQLDAAREIKGVAPPNRTLRPSQKATHVEVVKQTRMQRRDLVQQQLAGSASFSGDGGVHEGMECGQEEEELQQADNVVGVVGEGGVAPVIESVPLPEETNIATEGGNGRNAGNESFLLSVSDGGNIASVRDDQQDEVAIVPNPKRSSRKRTNDKTIAEEDRVDADGRDALKRKKARLQEKLNGMKYFAAVNIQLGERLPSGSKFQKLKIPSVGWTFENPNLAEDGSYHRLGKNSNIWVEADLLLAAQNDSSSVKQYARQLMSSVIVTYENLVKAHALKGTSVGFAKLFGKDNINSVYRHIVRLGKQKIDNKATGKWGKTMKSPQKLLEAWRKSFNGRMKLMDNMN